MKIVVECEVCEKQYLLRTHAFHSSIASYVKMSVATDDLDCPHCGAGGGHFNYHITADMVRELREESGAGVVDCKLALQEAEGDMEGARNWLLRLGRG